MSVPLSDQEWIDLQQLLIRLASHHPFQQWERWQLPLPGTSTRLYIDVGLQPAAGLECEHLYALLDPDTGRRAEIAPASTSVNQEYDEGARCLPATPGCGACSACTGTATAGWTSRGTTGVTAPRKRWAASKPLSTSGGVAARRR